MDGEVIDALLGLLDQRVAEDLPGQLLGDAADLLQRLVDRDGADRHGAVADDPFARVVDVAAGRQVHDRVGAPADRPDELVDLARDVAGDRGVADVGVDLDQEVAADRHRFGFGVVDVVGDDRAAAGDLVADEFGRDVVGDGGAEALAVADVLAQHLAAEVLAGGDIFHLGRDDAAAGIVHLADVRAGLARARGGLTTLGKRRDAAASGRGRAGRCPRGGARARVVALDVAARLDPLAAQLGQAGADVDAGVGVGVGAGGVVDVERRLAAAGIEVDRAHRDAQRADVDLAAAADRAGGDADLGAGGDVGHASALQ